MEIEEIHPEQFHPAWTVYKLSREEGYLRVAYIEGESFEEYFPTVWHLLAFRGNCRLKTLVEEDNLTKDKIWQAACCTPPGQDVPDDETRDRGIERVRENNQKELEEFRRFHVDKPVVDYVKVQPEYRRQGVATEMYEHMARWLAKRGLRLYASGIQRDGVKKLWAKLVEGEYPTGKHIVNGIERLYLDYGGQDD